MSKRYDAIVVGAGPAGSTCARTLAESKLQVLLLEKHAIIGQPLCCAEGISYSGLTSFVVPREEWISSRIDKVILVSPDKERLKINHPKAGFVLNRMVFDRDMALMAESAGANLKISADVIGLLKDRDGSVKGVRVQEQDKVVDYQARVIIGADGIESQIGKRAGLNTILPSEKIESCAQYLLENVELEKDCMEFYLGEKIAPGGYMWVFPKGENRANVGVGIAPHISSRKAIDYLNDFVKYRFNHFHIREKMMGGVPVFNKNNHLVKRNVLLVGDAGRIVDSLSGAGIYNAMLSGRICATVVSQYLKNGDLPLSFLQNYYRELMEIRGRELRFYAYCRALYLKLKDKDFNLIVSFLKSYFKDEEIKSINPIPIIKAILKFNPKILLLAKHLVW
ncbi:MAG: NAD(P)/FAD-dependent oxidoreductase [candidate division Zixibacteria bacterium]|nr:NAD(P)/FAD-dependent oxidoreductase [candidate division Zixibacteria bacterium]